MLESIPLPLSLMCWLGVGDATGEFDGGKNAAIICGGTLYGTSRRVVTQLWPMTPDTRESMGISGLGRGGMRLLAVS